MATSSQVSEESKKCSVCGEENPGDAIYCKNCGTRLDHDVENLTPANGNPGIVCGSKNTSNVAMATSESPQKETGEATRPTPTVRISGNRKYRTIKSQRQLTDTLSFVFSCLAILTSLIFSFLIGTTVRSPDVELASQTNFIYFFFGGAYQGTESNGVYGTISVVLGLVAILVCTVLSARAVFQYFRCTTLSITKNAVLSYFTYLSFVALFMFNISDSGNFTGTHLSTEINGMTLAGIIVGAVLISSSVILDFIGNFKSYFKKRFSFVQTGFAILFVILSLCILSFVSFGIMTFDMPLEAGETMAEEISLSVGLYYFTPNSLSTHLFAISTFVFSVAALVLIVLVAKDLLSGFGFAIEKRTLRLILALGVVTVYLGVSKMSFPIALFSEVVNIHLAAPILLLVFGCLIVGCGGAFRYLSEREPSFLSR